jgi:hypothetical protein
MPVLQFWLNAFIPRTVPGYTRLLSVGPHAGKTAIPLPAAARAWPGNWTKDWDAGYLTDQRGFDSSPLAAARMTSVARIDPSSFTLINQIHRTSGTTEVNLSSGAQTGFGMADMSRCRYTVLPPHAPPGAGFGGMFGVAHGGSTMVRPLIVTSLSLRLEAAASDPLVGAAADIDYNGALSVEPGPSRSLIVRFSGMVDAFPAYDCYASFDGVVKTMFTLSPPPGNTVVNLLGGANRPVAGIVTFP